MLLSMSGLVSSITNPRMSTGMKIGHFAGVAKKALVIQCMVHPTPIGVAAS